MKHVFKKSTLPAVVFVTGACILIIEVVAVRFLSPYYGSTIFTVSSVLSVILAALSFGYYFGGRLADKYASYKQFFTIIFAGGLTTLCFYAAGTIFVQETYPFFSIASGPLITTVIVFFLPALILGTLSPYAVKLYSEQLNSTQIGKAAGTIFFWSTAGSIVGSLLAGFVLIPTLGVQTIFIATSLLLCILGGVGVITFGLKKNLETIIGTFLLILIIISIALESASDQRVVYQDDGVYEKLTIRDMEWQGRPARFFYQDRSNSAGVFLDAEDPTDLIYAYTDYYQLYKLFDIEPQHALVIGGGMYSIPHALLYDAPEVHVDVSEIEPSLITLAEQYFSFPAKHERLTNIIKDGRRVLEEAEYQYDVIISDVYNSLFSIPPHFTTEDFYTLAKDKMSSDGIFIANFIGTLSRQQPSLLFTEINTFRTVFPHSYFFAVESPQHLGVQNIMFVGLKDDELVQFKELAEQTDNEFLQALPEHLIDLNRFDFSEAKLLTDDYAPVEYLTAQMLKQLSHQSFNTVNGDEALAMIHQQVAMGARYISSPGHKQLQDTLLAEMGTYADETVAQVFEYVDSQQQTHQLQNIIARFNPDAEKRVLFGTHYDTKQFADRDFGDPDQYVPGANDGASGVAVLVELARLLAGGLSKDTGVDIIFFDGEEGDPYLSGDMEYYPIGSTYFANHLNELYGAALPDAAVIVDMVCEEDLNLYKEITSVQHARLLVDTLWEIGSEISPHTFKQEQKYAITDDHTPLQAQGIPAALLIDIEYPEFHTGDDVASKCSAKSLEIVAETLSHYIAVFNDQ